MFLSLMTAPKSQFQKWMAAESQCEGLICVHGGLLGRAHPAKDNTGAQTLWAASPKPAASCTSLSPEKEGWEAIQRQENTSVGPASLCLYRSIEKFMQIKTSHRTAGKLPATLLVLQLGREWSSEREVSSGWFPTASRSIQFSTAVWGS